MRGTLDHHILAEVDITLEDVSKCRLFANNIPVSIETGLKGSNFPLLIAEYGRRLPVWRQTAGGVWVGVKKAMGVRVAVLRGGGRGGKLYRVACFS